MADNKYEMNNIPKEKFAFASREGRLHDKKLETKPVGYLKDAWIRFKKNKSSIVGAWIVIFIVLFAIIGPFCFNQDYIHSYEKDVDMRRYQYLTPKLSFAEPGSGFWDGTKVVEISESQYKIYLAREQETGQKAIVKVIDTYTARGYGGADIKMYKCRLDTYANIDVFTKQFTYDEYCKLQDYQLETGRQVILPWVTYYDKNQQSTINSKVFFNNINVWYECDEKGNPTFDQDGNLVNGYKKFKDLSNPSTIKLHDAYYSIRLEKDPAYGKIGSNPVTAQNKEDPTIWKDNTDDVWSVDQRYAYANPYVSTVGKEFETPADKVAYATNPVNWSYTVRLNPYEYFVYKYGFEPHFTFGTNANGWDIFTRLAQGARFSLLFAVAVSAINLVIGAIYGAIEGYYGGTADLIMERVSDILAAIPSMVVTVLFNLHLSAKVGVVPALLYSFIMTGWIGMASRTRMQFYRFKNQEYVLAARTLGARDRRVMFKHIFPNSLGTIITGSVLVIPGVIYSETSLTYLGIINLDSPTRSSVGAMLSAGQGMFTKFPHLVLFPAIFIGLLMVSFNLFGNGLRDAFNPSLRGVED
ncbi:MAG: ABC transporter permease [Clostridia bacterium]|nr:ABC transporter permease [Clostridia bacterium]